MKTGKILVELGAKPEKYETAVAKVLIGTGKNVVFLKPINTFKTKTPDIEFDGKRWEIKSPESSLESSIERNLKRASKQSANIVFDMRRMKNISRDVVRKNLLKQLKISHSLKQIIFIDGDEGFEKLTKKSK